MQRLRSTNRIACGVASAALLSIFAATTAEAKFPAESAADQTPPGVTVTGLGFASSRREAVRHAVRDARQRAAAIAAVLGFELGEVNGVDLPESVQFGQPDPCRADRKRSRRCPPRPPSAAAATVTFAIVGGSSGESAARWVYVPGVASAAVQPRDRSRNRSIKSAVLAVRRALAPQAASSARRQARAAAAATGLHLGAIVSVSESAPAYYYGPSFYDPALGLFGPGRFCGIVKRPIVRRDPETGTSKVVRRVPRRRCFVPSPYSVHLELRYDAG